MALVYKGEMPSCCAVCCDCNSAEDGNFCNRTGNRLRNDWQLYRPLNCPIIGEIPDKHGDLIEGEKVLKVLDAVLDNKEFIKIRQTLIDAVPIVVEATE